MSEKIKQRDDKLLSNIPELFECREEAISPIRSYRPRSRTTVEPPTSPIVSSNVDVINYDQAKEVRGRNSREMRFLDFKTKKLCSI